MIPKYMKAYTDIEESKVLAEILSFETADGYWFRGFPPQPYMVYTKGTYNPGEHIPCWSLAALLNVLPSATLDSSDDYHFRLRCMEKFTEWHDNAIDACVEMIERLHKQMIYDFNNS